MDQADHTSDEHVMQGWYAYAAEQPGSVGSWLRLVQERLQQPPEQQQREFGANDPQWLRLRGMRLPRPGHFTEDAQDIALACGLANPFAFTKALLIARGIEISSTTTSMVNLTRVTEHPEQYYMAAFDAQEDLDVLPEFDAGTNSTPEASYEEMPPQLED